MMVYNLVKKLAQKQQRTPAIKDDEAEEEEENEQTIQALYNLV